MENLINIINKITKLSIKLNCFVIYRWYPMYYSVKYIAIFAIRLI